MGSGASGGGGVSAGAAGGGLIRDGDSQNIGETRFGTVGIVEGERLADAREVASLPAVVPVDIGASSVGSLTQVDQFRITASEIRGQRFVGGSTNVRDVLMLRAANGHAPLSRNNQARLAEITRHHMMRGMRLPVRLGRAVQNGEDSAIVRMFMGMQIQSRGRVGRNRGQRRSWFATRGQTLADTRTRGGVGDPSRRGFSFQFTTQGGTSRSARPVNLYG